jgi:transketolase
LASAIAEWLSAQERQRAEFLGFSLADRFLHEVGSQDYARQRLGLSPEAIISGIKRALAIAA